MTEREFPGSDPGSEYLESTRNFAPSDSFMDDIKRYLELTQKPFQMSESAKSDEHFVYQLIKDYRNSVLAKELQEAKKLQVGAPIKLQLELEALDRILDHHAMKEIRIGDGVLEEGLDKDAKQE